MASSKAPQAKAVVVKLLVYLHLATLCCLRSVWNWTYEPVGFKCDHPLDPEQPNNTKIKVLVYGLYKTGTTQVSKTLRSFYKNSWHSEDFMLHFWSSHADEFWAKPENGGGMWPFQQLATPGYPAYHGHTLNMVRPWIKRPADVHLRANTAPEEFAYKLQKCRADSMTFDGYDELFWDIYEVSPDAKVLILNWRTFEQWSKSAIKFGASMYAAVVLMNTLEVGIHFLPWMAVVLPFTDWWNGDEVANLMKTGGRMTDIGTSNMFLFRMAITERRFLNHWWSGLGIYNPFGHRDVKAAFDRYWKKAMDAIPVHRRMVLDVSKHTTNDLCKFLGLEGHPHCDDKPLPKDTPVLLAHELTYPWSIPPCIPFFMFVHWVNYKLCWGVLGYIGSCLAQIFEACGIKCKKRKKKAKSS